MAIQLRSGKEVSNNRRKERKEETKAEQEETGNEGEKSTQTEQPEESNEQKHKEGVPAYTPTMPFPQGKKGKSSFLDSWTFSRK